jgi:hypothetical protein
MLSVRVAGQQDRQPAAKTRFKGRSDQWAADRKLCRKDYHWFTGCMSAVALRMAENLAAHVLQ